MTVDWELDHVGIVVKDMDDAVEHYQRLGIELLDFADLKTVGDPSKFCFVQSNAIRIKLIQPAEGDKLYYEYLNNYGEGVYHMGFQVKELEKEKARLVEQGFSILASVKREDGSDLEILFDTSEFGNVCLALYSEPTPFPVFNPTKGDWNLWHLGFVVKDIHKFADYYESIGFKMLARPFTGRPPAQDTTDQSTANADVSTPRRGRSYMCHLQNRQGSFLMAANQMLSGEGHFQDFIAQHGEGVEHIHFLVSDLPKEMDNMVAKGFPVISSQRRADGTSGESFYDTHSLGVRIALWGGEPSVKAMPEAETRSTEDVYAFYQRRRE